MKVLREIDVSHYGEFKIKLDPLNKGDYTVVVEFFPVHPPGQILTILTNIGVSKSATVKQEYKGSSVHNDDLIAIFQIEKETDGAGFMSVQFDILDPSGSAITADVIFYLVIYGVSGHVSNVPVEVFNPLWYITNGQASIDSPVSLKRNLNMADNQIKKCKISSRRCRCNKLGVVRDSSY